jgi:hypothetical protein
LSNIAAAGSVCAGGVLLNQFHGFLPGGMLTIWLIVEQQRIFSNSAFFSNSA